MLRQRPARTSRKRTAEMPPAATPRVPQVALAEPPYLPPCLRGRLIGRAESAPVSPAQSCPASRRVVFVEDAADLANAPDCGAEAVSKSSFQSHESEHERARSETPRRRGARRRRRLLLHFSRRRRLAGPLEGARHRVCRDLLRDCGAGSGSRGTGARRAAPGARRSIDLRGLRVFVARHLLSRGPVLLLRDHAADPGRPHVGPRLPVDRLDPFAVLSPRGIFRGRVAAAAGNVNIPWRRLDVDIP